MKECIMKNSNKTNVSNNEKTLLLENSNVEILESNNETLVEKNNIELNENFDRTNRTVDNILNNTMTFLEMFTLFSDVQKKYCFDLFYCVYTMFKHVIKEYVNYSLLLNETEDNKKELFKINSFKITDVLTMFKQYSEFISLKTNNLIIFCKENNVFNMNVELFKNLLFSKREFLISNYSSYTKSLCESYMLMSLLKNKKNYSLKNLYDFQNLRDYVLTHNNFSKQENELLKKLSCFTFNKEMFFLLDSQKQIVSMKNYSFSSRKEFQNDFLQSIEKLTSEQINSISSENIFSHVENNISKLTSVNNVVNCLMSIL